MGIVTEKFQISETPNENEDEIKGWVSDRSARVKKGTPGREGRHHGDWDSKAMNNAVCYNGLPPGSDVSDQEMADIRVQDFEGPMGCGSQVTNDLTHESLKRGYHPKKMLGTDDQFSNEHVDLFYSDVTVDGVTGFLERANVLDRS
jgi:hypothetical protein